MNINMESPTGEGKHLWSNLLEEVRENASVKLAPQRCLFVLGESECGKTTLISRLQGSEDVTKSYGLEYQYIDVKDEERDAQTKLGVYILDGNIELSRLTKFALNEKNFSDCLGILVVSLQEPGKIMDTLNDLYSGLQRHCDRVKIDQIERNQLKQSLVQYFREYSEPNAAGDTNLSTYQHVTNVPVLHGANRKHINPLHPPPLNVNTSNTDDGIAVPLSSEVLKENLGLPIIVVVTKTDVIDQLEKDKVLDEEQLEIIQMHIRKFCLERGAALFYTSVKEEKNCDLLKKYILHRFYGLPFYEPAYVVERDCVFVPCGWDNPNKIKILEENLVNLKDKCQDFSKCIRIQSINSTVAATPTSTTTASMSEFMTARDEQNFLEDVRVNLDNFAKMLPAPGPDSMNFAMQQNRSTGAAHNRSTAAAAAQMKARPKLMSTESKRFLNEISYAAGAGGANPNVQAGEGVLANFFNSLLKKTNAPNAAGNNTPPLSSTAPMQSGTTTSGSAQPNSSSSSVTSDNGVGNTKAKLSQNAANASQQEQDVS